MDLLYKCIIQFLLMVKINEKDGLGVCILCISLVLPLFSAVPFCCCVAHHLLGQRYTFGRWFRKQRFTIQHFVIFLGDVVISV